MIAAIKNLRKASVKGSMSERDHLRIGEVAPHIILAMTSAIIAAWVLVKLIRQIF